MPFRSSRTARLNQGVGHARHRPIALLEIADVRAFVKKTDEDINAFLLDDELVGWLKR